MRNYCLISPKVYETAGQKKTAYLRNIIYICIYNTHIYIYVYLHIHTYLLVDEDDDMGFDLSWSFRIVDHGGSW